MQGQGAAADLSAIRSELIHALHGWWLSHCGKDIPERLDLDPGDLKQLLPNMIISDVEPAPFRIRYRLVGTNVASAAGLNFTGCYLDELIPPDRDGLRLLDYEHSYRKRLPVLGTSAIRTSAGERSAYEYGVFPLRNGGRFVAQFVELEDYFVSPRQNGTLEKWRRKRTPVI